MTLALVRADAFAAAGELSGLSYQTIASGALIQGLDAVTAGYLIATGQQAQLAQYVNPALAQAEANLPEQTMVQLDITGWSTWFGSAAQYIASQIQSAWQSGKIVDPNTGQTPPTWSGTQWDGVFASGDDTTDTVSLRWVKGLEFLVVVVIGLLVLLAIALIVVVLQRSNAGTMYSATHPSSPGGSGLNLVTELTWVEKNAYWLLPATGLLVVSPFVLRKVAETREAENALTAAERGAT